MEVRFIESLISVREENLKVLELLLEKYPHAFVADSKERRILVTRPVKGRPNAVITQGGVYFISMRPFEAVPVPEEIISKVDLARVVGAAFRDAVGVTFSDGKWRGSFNIVKMPGGSIEERASQLEELLAAVEEKYTQGLRQNIVNKEVRKYGIKNYFRVTNISYPDNTLVPKILPNKTRN